MFNKIYSTVWHAVCAKGSLTIQVMGIYSNIFRVKIFWMVTFILKYFTNENFANYYIKS